MKVRPSRSDALLPEEFCFRGLLLGPTVSNQPGLVDNLTTANDPAAGRGISLNTRHL